MLVEPGVVDTNILVYAVDADAPQHAACRALLAAARDPAVRLYVTTQILCEFYSVITNPRRVAVARSPAEAVGTLAVLLGLPGIRILPMPAQTAAYLMELLRHYPVKGGDVFDLQLVATMQTGNVQRIYTFNIEDFAAFPELSVQAPTVN